MQGSQGILDAKTEAAGNGAFAARSYALLCLHFGARRTFFALIRFLLRSIISAGCECLFRILIL